MKFYKIYSYVLLSILLGGVLSGCDNRSAEQSSSSSRKKDELVIAVGGESEFGYDPVLGWGRYGSPLFHSTLLRRNETLELEGDLAVKWELSPDRLLWKVTIREDVRFSDGEKLTAEDIAFTFEKTAKSAGLADLSMLEKVSVISDNTLEFRLKQPASTFLNRMATLGIVSKRAYGPGYAHNPIGSGPYRFVRWDEGQQLIAEANPYYYGGEPEFKRVVFLFMSSDSAFAAAKAGQLDVAAIPQVFADDPVPGMHLVAVPSVDNRGLSFPYRPKGTPIDSEELPVGNDVTSDRAIRRAINYAIDRKELVTGILNGYGSPAFGPTTGLPWDEPSVAIQDGDQVTARDILQQGGWSDSDGDSIVEKNGVKASFTLLYRSDDIVRQGLAMAVSEMLKPIGIDARVEGMSWDQITKVEHRDVVVFGWGSHDQSELYNLYHSSTSGAGHFNPGYYLNPAVDIKLDMAMNAVTEEEANRYWRAAQWDGKTGFGIPGDAAWCWLVNIDHTYLVRDDLDLGTLKLEPHGHGWPITDNLHNWRRLAKE